ncbi:DUF4920 domain-containing protein [Spongiivirga citrea]|uniref:DUF4920 domain-containing protein n=2 Tax=Spongiivirga citrea TaxID=1481457 RepID=A0A6M0CKT2_9FLAO|nr:DUF4920 domain-containing protein [Spongiivirga citrea]
MKVIQLFGLILMTCGIVSCQRQFENFGAEVKGDRSTMTTAMLKKYESLKENDTIQATFEAPINSVCAKKGCWMRLDMGNGQETMVRFKDYGFFMPLDAKGNVIVQGKAFVSKTSVEDLKHYAKDAGKSEEEIAAITKPEVTYSFIADGVLLEK